MKHNCARRIPVNADGGLLQMKLSSTAPKHGIEQSPPWIARHVWNLSPNEQTRAIKTKFSYKRDVWHTSQRSWSTLCCHVAATVCRVAAKKGVASPMTMWHAKYKTEHGRRVLWPQASQAALAQDCDVAKASNCVWPEAWPPPYDYKSSPLSCLFRVSVEALMWLLGGRWGAWG